MNDSLKSSMQTPSAGYSITLRLKIENKPGRFAKIVKRLAELEASLSNMELEYSDYNFLIRKITVNCASEERAAEIVESAGNSSGIELLEWQDDTIEIHRGGKLEILSKGELETTDQLSRAYTPGVARICQRIHDNPQEAYDFTMKGNTVAVVSDGSAVLGLGNIGPEAAMPVMEGKAALFRRFAGLNSVPICLKTQDQEEIIQTIINLSPAFGGINLEDISAPRCFEIEERLQEELDIPVFHDDQHGTAVVLLAGLINALKIVNKPLDKIRLVMSGFGAGGVACTRILMAAGVKNIIPCDSRGAVYESRTDNMNPVKEELAAKTNPEKFKGSIPEALKGADVFVGVSRPGVISADDVKTMAKDPIVFALANPEPEVLPGEIEDIARIIATGRSDYANQVNNVLCFPGIFKGAIAARVSKITDEMKLAAAKAIADCVSEEQLHERYIIPSVFRAEVADKVAEQVRACAENSK